MSNIEHPILDSDIRFIGVGNEHRRDDGVGIFIVRHLGRLHLPGARIAETRRDAIHLMDLWQGAGVVFVFDALYAPGRAGAIYRLDAVNEPIPADLLQVSTHTLDIAEAVELSRVLNQLPTELILFGVGGKNFGQGQGLSRQCRQSALRVIRQAADEIRDRSLCG